MVVPFLKCRPPLNYYTETAIIVFYFVAFGDFSVFCSETFIAVQPQNSLSWSGKLKLAFVTLLPCWLGLMGLAIQKHLQGTSMAKAGQNA